MIVDCVAANRRLVVLLLLIAILATMTSSFPVRSRRHAPRYGGHLRRHREQTASSSTADSTGSWPATYSYHLPRPSHCRHDDRLFADCYLCGKLIDDVRIYNGCCDRSERFQWYCDSVMSN